jgi:predicted Zn-dependent protease
MSHVCVRCLLSLISLSLPFTRAAAQAPDTHVEETARKEPTPVAPVAPFKGRQLFGTLPIATRSDDARKLLEKAVDQYENVLLDMSVENAHKAANKDSHFALAYAVWSYAASRTQPVPEALARAKTLAPTAAPEERLLVDWLIDVQEGANLPAIGAMNDLLERFPNDKHVLYLTSEWLYFQQDYDRARKMMEKIIQIDPNFPPALNMLGYAYIETGDPDPAKAISYLKRYAAVQPSQPNPEDSLGEVLRFAGDDQGSLQHFAAALKIITNFITSQVGMGDTYTLMGDYARARVEYDKAAPMATNSRDRLHGEFQKALVYFWEGQPEAGRKALDSLLEDARKQKDPYAQFEIGFGRAALSADIPGELEQLHTLEATVEQPIAGMAEPDRHLSWASVVREEARVAALSGRTDIAHQAIAKLESSAMLTRDLIVENNYEAARGFLLFSQGDFANAADALASDPHSPLALQELANAQDKLANAAAAENARTRLKYQRAPTVEWYQVTHPLASGTP